MAILSAENVLRLGTSRNSLYSKCEEMDECAVFFLDILKLRINNFAVESGEFIRSNAIPNYRSAVFVACMQD